MLFPSAYVKWREPLCVWSHVAHKLAQAAVTLVPPVGTIFSSERSHHALAVVLAVVCLTPRHAAGLPCAPGCCTHPAIASHPHPRRLHPPTPPHLTPPAASYNPTVALLESSSLAQVHMLSFGMRLRFGTHLAVDLFHFAAAVAANDQVRAWRWVGAQEARLGRRTGAAAWLPCWLSGHPMPSLNTRLPPPTPPPPPQICAAGFPFIPGGACNALMFIWQALACFALPCALVYASERRSRRIFLETSGQAA